MSNLNRRKVLDKGFVRFDQLYGIPTEGQSKLSAHISIGLMIKAPMFVAHHFDTGNEWYTPVISDFYTPTVFLDSVGKQLSDKDSNELYTKFNNFNTWAYNFYNKLVDRGIHKNQAKLIIPTTMYVEFYWTAELYELEDFIRVGLRDGEPMELRKYAETLLDFYVDHLPEDAAKFIKRDLNRVSN